MRGPRLLAALLAVAALSVTGGAYAANGHANSHAVFPGPAVAAANCHAALPSDVRGNPLPASPTPKPTALTPQDFWSAYKLPGVTGLAGTGPTVAIVDAYDYPTVDNDLQVFSSTYGLPQCTQASGCLRVAKQVGRVRVDQGWALEEALDVQTVHGTCPTCRILLVEAKSNSFSNLMAAVDYALSNADYVSNSYGASEFSGETAYDSHFNVPGKAITVSSGDNGYGVEYPATSPWVTAVGGTFLQRDSSARGWSETAWSGAGSGCSLYEPKQSWQTDPCAGRTVADVSADADPNSGASIYSTTPYNSQTGWWQIGGTSLAAPLVAGVYALAGNGSSVLYGSFPYANASGLFDITSGSNGTCSPAYLCTAGAGYDGPTGLGTPNGTSGF